VFPKRLYNAAAKNRFLPFQVAMLSRPTLRPALARQAATSAASHAHSFPPHYPWPGPERWRA